MGVALLDTSAVIGYLDRDDPLHPGAVAAIDRLVRAGSSLAISAVSWAELLDGTQHGHQDELTIRGFVTDLGVNVTFVDAVIAAEAASLQGRYARTGSRTQRPRLRTPDALILATAEVFGDVDTVVCGDAKWAKVPGVRAEVVSIANSV